MKETAIKVLKKLEKVSYIFQFIFSLLLGIGLYKLLVTKSIYGYWHKWYLLYSAILIIVNLAIMIFHIKKYKDKIEKIFLNFAIPIGMLFLVFMIPGQVPDEEAHMIKTYEVSQGILHTPINEDGKSHTTIPEELLEFNHNKMNSYSKLNEQISKKTDYSKTIETVSSAQTYSWILYVVPAIAMFIARTLQLNLAISIYMAKIANFILFLIFGYYTIRKIPFGKIVMTVYLLMPMMFQQALSFSADVFTNSLALYMIAYILYLMFKKENVENKELVLYCILVIFLAIAKLAYIPLVGIGLILIFRNNITKKQKVIFLTLSILLGLIFSLSSYIGTAKYTTTSDSMNEYYKQLNVNSAEQTQLLIKNPIKAVKVIGNDWLTNMGRYVKMCIGSELGWLNIKPSTSIITLYLLLLIFAVIMEKNEYTLKILEKIWILLIAFGIIALVQIAMYTSFTPVEADFIGGVQGRYFIPIFILPLLCISMKDNYIKSKNPNVTLTTIASILNIFVLISVFIFFK